MKKELFPSGEDRPGEHLISLSATDAEFLISALQIARRQTDQVVQGYIHEESKPVTHTLEQLRNLTNSYGERAEMLGSYFGIDPDESGRKALLRADDRL